MELTILLAKVFGLYLIIGGAAIMIRQRYFIPVVGGFAQERLLRMMTSVFELIAGLFLVVTHNVWGSLAEVIVTLFGWLALLEGAFYLLASDAVVERWINKFNTRSWYTWGGIVSILLGIYLAGYGFAWF